MDAKDPLRKLSASMFIVKGGSDNLWVSSQEYFPVQAKE